jgi:hypothetical protein
MWKPIGTEVIRISNDRPCRYIKVRDDGPPQLRWRPLAHHVWVQAHGVIPKGHRIVHADLDPLNDALINLRCLSGAEAVAWQYAAIPGMQKRRRTRAASATRRRWEHARLAKEHHQSVKHGAAGAAVVFVCAACGHQHDAASLGKRCPKCGGHACEKLARPVEQLEGAAA